MGSELRAAALGLAQTVAIAAAFVGGGLGFAAAARGPDALRSAASPAYPSAAMPGTLWLVDGFNVIQVGLLAGRDRAGWWREDRRRDLLERAGRLAGPDDEVIVVFDGPAPAEDRRGVHLRAVFADPADDWLLARLRERGEAARVRVVTADRSLADRARRRGAEVVAPRAFLARCGADAPAEPPGSAPPAQRS